jgi:hypothetical protein
VVSSTEAHSGCGSRLEQEGLEQGGSEVGLSDGHREEPGYLVRQLSPGILELDYLPAYDETALRDLEEGKLDDRVGDRSELLE